MSNFKKLLIPAIVLIILVAAYVIVQNLPQKEEEDTTPAAETIQIFDFVKDDIEEIRIDNRDEPLWFRYTAIQVEEEETKEDGTVEKKLVDRKVWQAVQPEGMKVNSSSVDSIAWNANTLKAQKIIEENPSDLSVFGLDNPVKLIFIMKDRTEHNLFVGNETPTKGAFYVRKNDEPVVYTINSYEAGKFLQTKFDLMVKDIYTKTYEYDNFASISFIRKGNKVFDAGIDEEKTWWLSYPIEAEARSENLYTITQALTEITVSEYIEENAEDLQKYGLVNPSYIFEYSVGGEGYKLALGNKAPDGGGFYAVLNNENLVFTVSDSNFTFLDKPIEEIVSSFVHLQNIADVSGLRVTLDGRTHISKINVDSDDEDKSTYEFNGILLTGDEDSDYISAFKKYYQGAIGLLVNKIVLDVEPLPENPEVSVEYTLKNGEKILIELVSTPDNISYYALKNGKYTGITLRKAQLNDESFGGLRYTYNQLVEKLKERN